MTEALSSKELNTLQILLTYDSPSSMYGMLSMRGYKYATLAQGVVYESSISGSAASNFLKLTAQRTGRTLPAGDFSVIYKSMGQGYLDALVAQFDREGSVTRDINHHEAWALHNETFNSLRLTPDAWTLNSVFSVMSSDAIRDTYWNEVLNSAGDPVGELIVAARTETFMATAAVIGTPEVKAIANEWRARVATPSTLYAAVRGAGGMIGARIDNVFDNIANSAFGAQGSSYMAQNSGLNPAPTPTPAIAVLPAPPPSPPVTPPIPAPPIRNRRRGGGGRGRSSSTTRLGHPDSGHHGGARSGSSGGGRLTILP